MGLLDKRRRYNATEKTTPVVPNYLKLTARAAGTFTFTINASLGTTNLQSVSYSIDNGRTWTKTNNSSNNVTITTPSIAIGESVLWKGVGNSLHGAGFSSTMYFDASGNLMSLLYGDNFEGEKTLTHELCFSYLFYNSKIWNALSLELPATTLTKGCYKYMFGSSYYLESVPTLPALSLTNDCYLYMFSNCTNLRSAPELPALTLTNGCYSFMFSGCTKLNKIKCMAISGLGSTGLYMWVNGVAASGTFIKNVNAKGWQTGANGIPSGWTVQTASS